MRCREEMSPLVGPGYTMWKPWKPSYTIGALYSSIADLLEREEMIVLGSEQENDVMRGEDFRLACLVMETYIEPPGTTR